MNSLWHLKIYVIFKMEGKEIKRMVRFLLNPNIRNEKRNVGMGLWLSGSVMIKVLDSLISSTMTKK